MKLIFLILLFLAGIGELAHSYYSDSLNWLELTDSQLLIERGLSYFRDIPLIIVTSWSIIYSISRFNKQKSYKIASMFLVLSIGSVTTLLVNSDFILQKANKTLNEKTTYRDWFDSKRQDYESALLLENIDPIDSMKKTKIIAERVYFHSGEKINIVNSDGEIVQFSPSIKIKANRIKFKEHMGLFLNLRIGVINSRALWLSVLIISILIGIMGLIKNNYNKANAHGTN